ncbi:MAG TPA: hypothetical protein VJ140_09070 [Actinomycetota bacterium]|nr:hypothetical protein [Actinomycetota bacterium]
MLVAPGRALHARWEVNAYAESLGAGPEVRLGTQSQDKNTWADHAS